MEDAVQRRLQAQANQKHFEKKLEEEGTKVEAAERQQVVFENEFIVRYLVHVMSGSSGLDGS